MKGFTLIESMVVIAILAILALASINTITEFQKNAILTSAAQELVSTIRVARADSMSGLVKIGETYEDDGYPFYGVFITGNTYDLKRTFTPYGASQTIDTVESHTADSSITLSASSPTITFTRITGDPSSTPTITLTRTGTTTSKTITVNSNGLVSL